MALIIRADGTQALIEGKGKNGSLSLQQLQGAVGGYIEFVPCDPEVTGGYDHFYCNEEGKLKRLPINPTACHMSTLTGGDDYIVGDVIFCKSGMNGEDGMESF